ncbi:MAG: hypothetical protein KAF27_04830 [Porphyrobacter sp.]|nr:hypothetical protein [Porphyrobacter sp.]
MSIWQRLAGFVTAMDAAFDPAEGDRARLRALEARVRELEAREQNGGIRD